MKANIKPIKSLGQNFLSDPNIIKKIVDSIEINDKSNLIEIGPGTGALTKQIVGQNSYLGVELDKRSFLFLSDNLSSEKMKFINQDFLKFDLGSYLSENKIDQFIVFGNLPYYITSSIIFKLYELEQKPIKAIFMVQKEVAQRIVAKAGTKENGILSVLTAFTGSAKKLFDVSPNCFYPKPKVWSSIIEITFEKKSDISFKEFATLIKTAFNQRRKMLSNSLKSYGTLPERFSSRRPESLNYEEFIELFKAL